MNLTIGHEKKTDMKLTTDWGDGKEWNIRRMRHGHN